MEPTLQEIFGAGAAQTATTITILKADLVSTGLTPSANNSGESLLGSMIAKASVALPESTFQTNLNQSVTIVRQSDSVTFRGQDTYTQKPWLINFSKIAPAPTFNPNDY